jgi:hypothetical protein
MSGNAVISDNEAANNGGGVALDDTSSNFEMSGNAVISDNEAANNGGGVYFHHLYSISAKFTMIGGTIKGNQTTSTTSGSGGGGVYIDGSTSLEIFVKTGGTIYGDLDATHTIGPDVSENTAASGDGHAVLTLDGRKRNSDTGPEVNLNTLLYGAPWQ